MMINGGIKMSLTEIPKLRDITNISKGMSLTFLEKTIAEPRITERRLITDLDMKLTDIFEEFLGKSLLENSHEIDFVDCILLARSASYFRYSIGQRTTVNHSEGFRDDPKYLFMGNNPNLLLIGGKESALWEYVAFASLFNKLGLSLKEDSASCKAYLSLMEASLRYSLQREIGYGVRFKNYPDLRDILDQNQEELYPWCNQNTKHQERFCKRQNEELKTQLRMLNPDLLDPILDFYSKFQSRILAAIEHNVVKKSSFDYDFNCIDRTLDELSSVLALKGEELEVFMRAATGINAGVLYDGFPMMQLALESGKYGSL